MQTLPIETAGLKGKVCVFVCVRALVYVCVNSTETVNTLIGLLFIITPHPLRQFDDTNKVKKYVSIFLFPSTWRAVELSQDVKGHSESYKLWWLHWHQMVAVVQKYVQN